MLRRTLRSSTWCEANLFDQWLDAAICVARAGEGRDGLHSMLVPQIVVGHDLHFDIGTLFLGSHQARHVLMQVVPATLPLERTLIEHNGGALALLIGMQSQNHRRKGNGRRGTWRHFA